MRLAKETGGSYLAQVFALTFVAALAVGVSFAEEGDGPHHHHPHMTPAQKTAMDECLSAAGITPPSKEQRESGERPQFTDAQKAAFKACHLKVMGKDAPPPPPPQE